MADPATESKRPSDLVIPNEAMAKRGRPTPVIRKPKREIQRLAPLASPR